MTLETECPVPRARPAATAGLARLRRGSLAVLVLVVEYTIGMYVNLYVTVPAADQRGGLSETITSGPDTLSLHAVLGLLLGLGALGVASQSIFLRRRGPITASVIGLLTVVFGSVAETGFTSTGDDSASMAMSVLTGVAMLCYAANLYLLGMRGGSGVMSDREATARYHSPGSRLRRGTTVPAAKPEKTEREGR